MADKYGVELTFFHGKGGTVGRGGNPALYRAIQAHPPNTINGRFRVTEQGEMIRQNFGSLEIAERSVDIYTAALLRESFTKHVEPKQSWRDEMDHVAEVSCAAYRNTVRVDPRFVPYFRQATPELELGKMLIGSRPAKRNPKGGVESLRAIPWTFAWAQTRMHLSAWLGVGDGLTAKVSNREKKMIRFACVLLMITLTDWHVQTTSFCRTRKKRKFFKKCMMNGLGSERSSRSSLC